MSTHSINEPHVQSESPAPAWQVGLPPILEARAICRDHSSWRGRIRAIFPLDGTAMRCLRVARFTLMLGPWRSLTVAALRYVFRNRVFPRISPTMFPHLDVDATSKALDHDGFAVGLQLPRSSIKKITELAAKAEVVEEAHWDCAEIDRIAHDTAIVEVVKRYLGVEPILHSTVLFWTLPNKSGKAIYPETFHYDVGDFKAVCVCFYLTEVVFDSAPHVAIAGTHKSKSIARLINPFMTDEDAAQRFGPRVVTFVGEAGMGFFEDNVTQHKRLACATPRLALFINYTLRRKPDTVPGSAKVKR